MEKETCPRCGKDADVIVHNEWIDFGTEVDIYMREVSTDCSHCKFRSGIREEVID